MGQPIPALRSAMKNLFQKGGLILLMLLGLAVLLYPTVSRRINGFHSSTAVQDLSQQLQNTDQAELERQLALAEGYNEALREQLEFSVEYDGILNFGNGSSGWRRNWRRSVASAWKKSTPSPWKTARSSTESKKSTPGCFASGGFC